MFIKWIIMLVFMSIAIYGQERSLNYLNSMKTKSDIEQLLKKDNSFPNCSNNITSAKIRKNIAEIKPCVKKSLPIPSEKIFFEFKNDEILN